ncbi:MAG: ArnT family glycosyltransferase [Microgenomates group bacterium]
MKKILSIILIIFLTAFLIFFQKNQIPKNLTFDEVEFAKLALSLEKQPYTPYSPLATGHSTFYFYILLFSLKIFGINTFALRLPSAIFAILSSLIFFLILKKINQKFSFLAIIIFITSRWFINFSRFSFEATFLLFLELTSIFFLLKNYQQNKNFSFKNIDLILSGLFAGLAFNSYTPGRIFFIVPLSIILFHLIKNKQFNNLTNLTIKQLLYFLVPFVIIITPLTLYLLKNQDTRVDQLFFWKNHQMSINEKITGTLENIKSTALMFFFKGDLNGRHNYPGKPALNPILAGLMIFGFFISLKKFLKTKDFFSFIFIFYFFVSIFPSLPIYPWENPSMLRTFTTLPSIIFFVIQAIEFLNNFLIGKKLSQNLVFFIFYLLILFSSFYELRTYFKYQAIVFDSAFEVKYPLEKAIKIKLNH